MRTRRILFYLGMTFAVTISASLQGEPLDELTQTVWNSLTPKLQNELVPKQETPSTQELRLKILDYYQGKEFNYRALDLPFSSPARIAEGRALLKENVLTLLEREYPFYDSSGDIDWERKDSRGDKEWAWMLNRHDFLTSLWFAYEATENTAYLQKLNFLLLDWLTSNPYPSRLSFSPQWRALEAARRILSNWVFLFYKLQPHPEFENETRIRFLASIIDHAHLFRNHPSFWGGNHLLTELRALQTLAYAWPEFNFSQSDRQFAEEEFAKELLKQTYPDGSYKELSNHYHRVVLVNAHAFLKIKRLDPINQPSSNGIESRILQMWDFYYQTMRPNGTGPLNNASDLEQNFYLLQSVADFYNRPEWKSLDSLNQLPNLKIFPWAGQAIFRSNNHPDTNPSLWAYFNFGPYGSAHQHKDRLHLSVDFGNQPFLVDSGRYHYLPGKWSQYFKGPKSHNVLTLNGKPSSRLPRTISKPLPFKTHSGENWIGVSAEATFNSPTGLIERTSKHQRILIQHSEEVFIVIDHVVTFSRQNAIFHWQFHPSITPDERDQGLQLIYASTPLTTAHLKGSSHPVAGWYSEQYNQKSETWQSEWKGQTSKPAIFIWLIQKPNSSNPIRAEGIHLENKKWEITLTTSNNQTSSIIIDLDHL